MFNNISWPPGIKTFPHEKFLEKYKKQLYIEKVPLFSFKSFANSEKFVTFAIPNTVS